MSSPTTATATDWDAMGFKFSIIPEERYDEVCEFIHKNNCPDEPIARSLGTCIPGSLVNKMQAEVHWKPYLKNGKCLMVVNKEDKLLGTRLGKKVTRSSYESHNWIFRCISLFKWILPQVALK